MKKNRLFRRAAALFTACMILAGNVLLAAAVDTSQSYAFEVSVNGEENVAVEPGETVEVVLSLSRTDQEGPMTIYAMSAVIRFNTNLMELDNLTAGTGISSTVTELSGSLEGWSDVTLNYLAPSMSGTEWENGITLVTLTLKATRYGSSLIQTRRGSVSTYSGMDSFSSSLGSAVVSVQSVTADEDPSIPITPTEPGGTVNPATPAEPGGTTIPATPTEPGGTSTPATPTEPGGTSTPAIPTEPDGTPTPATPIGPDGSTEPSMPDKPGDSVNPSESAQPTNPAVPSTPTVPADPDPAGYIFTDVAADAWYANAIRYVVTKAYFNGIGADTFGPDLTMTRAMFVTVLGRVSGVDLTKYSDTSFNDVPKGRWYTAYVEWAAENGIVTGYDSECFGPDNPVTREQMAAILYRYAKYSGKDVTAEDAARFHDFTDSDKVSDYAKTPMIWATDKGLINGMGDGTLAPQKTSTRAQVAQIIMNYDEKDV